jgi:hypothetical protein
MSSPSRQISNRRLPPLPNSSRSSPIRRIPSGGSVKTTSASTNSRHGPASNHQGNQVNNHGHYDLNVPFNEGPFRPALIQGKAIGERPTPDTHGKSTVEFVISSELLRTCSYCQRAKYLRLLLKPHTRVITSLLFPRPQKRAVESFIL